MHLQRCAPVRVGPSCVALCVGPHGRACPPACVEVGGAHCERGARGRVAPSVSVGLRVRIRGWPLVSERGVEAGGGSTARSGRGDTAGCGISCVRGSVSVGPHGRACPPREESPNVGCGAPWERGTNGTEWTLRGVGGGGGRAWMWGVGATRLGLWGGGGVGDGPTPWERSGPRGRGTRADVGEAPRLPPVVCPTRDRGEGSDDMVFGGGTYTPPSLPLPAPTPRTRVGSRSPPCRTAA